MEKKGKNISQASIPDNAFKVREIGQWTIFWADPEKSFYFTSSTSPSSVLRLSRDELVTLVKEIEMLGRPGRDAASQTPSVEEVTASVRPHDKREFRRFAKRCEAEITSRGITKKCLASDFSINGLFIRTSRPFPPDEVIEILLHLPDNRVSSLQGNVTRAMNNPLGNTAGSLAKIYRNGMGVKITKKDAVYLHFIRSMIK